MRAIYFDMDGTIVDFYNVPNWFDSLLKEHIKPYRIARPLVNMRSFSRVLQNLQEKGYIIGIISWASRGASPEFCEKISKAKIDWLRKHCGAVAWDEVHIVEYGTEKWQIADYPEGILFDDELNNREKWNEHGGTAHGVENILEILAKYLQHHKAPPGVFFSKKVGPWRKNAPSPPSVLYHIKSSFVNIFFFHFLVLTDPKFSAKMYVSGEESKKKTPEKNQKNA